jgi:small subunit ribosomal protein S3e
MNKKKRFVADGVFHAELHSFFLRSLDLAGYAGFEVRVTPVKTDVVIKATKTQEVLGPEGRRIKELASLL